MVIKDITDLPAPHKDTPACVAVDNGYAGQKIAYWADVDGTKRMVCFSYPSRAKMGRVNINFDGGAVAGIYNVNGQDYTVSQQLEDPDSIRTAGYAFSELNCALVTHSLVQAGFRGREVILGTGLPFKDYFVNGEKNQSFIDKVQSSLKADITDLQGHDLALIKSHLLYPESTAAYVDFVFNDETLDLETHDTETVVIDMGGNTTDITTITAGKPTINIEKSSSKVLGVLNIRDELRSLIVGKFKIEKADDHLLDKTIQTGSFRFWREDKDVSDLVKQAKQKTIKRLMTYVEETIGDGAFIENLLFVGGGAVLLQDEFKAKYPQATIGENPEFANARGMLKFMTYIANHG